MSKMSNYEPEPFKEFAIKHPNENYKELVRMFSIKENAELKRKVKPPMIIKGKKTHVLVSYYSLAQYKAMAQNAINAPLANKEGVIKTLRTNYINKPFKATISDAGKIYDNLTNGANHFITGNKFLCYSNEIAIEELIKFEMFLLNGCKEENKKTETSLNDFFPSLKLEEIENLQIQFANTRGLEMACFIHQMVESKTLEFVKNSPKKSFSKFCEVFAGMGKSDKEAVRKLFNYGAYSLENENHLDNYKTKEKIKQCLEVG